MVEDGAAAQKLKSQLYLKIMFDHAWSTRTHELQVLPLGLKIYFVNVMVGSFQDHKRPKLPILPKRVFHSFGIGKFFFLEVEPIQINGVPFW